MFTEIKAIKRGTSDLIFMLGGRREGFILLDVMNQS